MDTIIKKITQTDGYVTRTPDSYDLRSVRVFLTDAGRAIYDDAVSYIQTSESRIMKNVSPREVEQLSTILQKIYTNMKSED